MELSYQEDSKSSSEEVDRPSEQINDEMGIGRSYECVFCRRGFTTAQALGGHMNIHRKDRANKAKSNFPPSSSAKVDDGNNYTDLGLYSASNPSFLTTGNYYSTLPDQEVDTNYNYYHQLYFPSHACGAKSPSRVQYGEVLCVENQRDPHQFLFGQDWRQRGLSLYTNPLCVHENKEKIENNSEEDDLDLELRLGHHP